MNYQELTKTNIINNVYLIKGDAFLCQTARNKIEEMLNISKINVSVFTDENFDTNDVINACNQFTFFGEKRIVVILDIAKELSTDNKLKFEKYAKNPNLDCYLLIIDTNNFKTFDFLKNIEIIECKPNENFVVNFIGAEFEKYSKTIDVVCCKKINDYCLGNINRIVLEIKKISDYLSHKQQVDEKTIDMLVFKDTELKVFDLTNALGNKNGNMALKMLHNMLNTGEPPIKILALISGTFRRMMFAKINKGANADLAKILGVKEFAITKAKELSSKFTAGQLKKIHNLLLEADYYIKSGQMSQENSLYYLVCKIISM